MANDCQVAALAEYTFGAGDPTMPLVVIKVGYGVGAGIIVNGQLLRGQPYGAGEIGHVVMAPDGALCRCGNRGCLETIVGRQPIVRRVQALAQAAATPRLAAFAAAPEVITLDTVYELYEAGDEAVQQVIREVGCHLGLAIANLISALGCCRVLLTGSVTSFGQGLLDVIRDELGRRALPSLVQCSEIALASAGDIVLRGAAALVLAQELRLP